MSAAQIVPEEVRRTYIGSHDTAGIAGFHPWLNPSQVFMNKLGMSTGSQETEPMHFGTLIQPVILAEFASRMNVTLEPERFIRHPTLEWFGGTPDGTIQGRKAGVDAKNIRFAHPAAWGDEGSGEVPEYIAFQAHHFMTLLDYDVWYIAVLVAGNEFRIYTIERDKEISDLIVEMDSVFWKDHVLAGIPPPIDDSESCRRMLERLHPKEKEGVREATEAEVELLTSLRLHEDAITSHEKAANTIENRLRESLGDASGIICDLGRVSYKQAKGRIGIDAKTLRQEMPDIAKRYEKHGEPQRVLKVTFKREREQA